MIRRRRLVALVLAVLVLGALLRGAWALTGLISGWVNETASAEARPAEETPSAPEEPTSAEPAACDAADLGLAVDPRPGAEGVSHTEFAVTLTNEGEEACLVDAGASSLVLTVRSGEDRVWSSGDCPSGRTERLLLLDAGDSAETTVGWDGYRSEEGCGESPGRAGSGTYRVVAELGGTELGDEETFEL